jgi:hypothetical protein
MMKRHCFNVLIVVGSHLAHVVSIGMAVSFGILYSEIKTELKTSHAETAWIFSLFNGLLGLTGKVFFVLLITCTIFFYICFQNAKYLSE